MLFRILFIFVLSNLGSAVFVGPAFAATSSAPTILIYGDSLSAAYGIPREQGWVALLQQRLKAQGFPHQVVNTSISGETTSGGLSRMRVTLQQHKPEIVVLELGANDGLRGLPVAEMQKNLDSMIKASKEAKARVLLLGMMIPPNYGPRYTREFRETYPQLAQRYDLPFLPFFLDGIAGKTELTLDDGLHPTASAQPYILDNIWKTLQPMLNNSSSQSAKKQP